MGQRIRVLLAIFFGLLILGITIAAVSKGRQKAQREGCLNNFRKLGQFAATYSNPPEGKTRESLKSDVPAGTVMNAGLPPDERLSWIVGNLDSWNSELSKKIDRTQSWNAEPNREPSQTPLKFLLCPGAIPVMPAGSPALSQYVGLGGVGIDAAKLDLGPPIPNRSGCFRYDSTTPLALIAANDGLAQTAMFTETANSLGPWVRGGPSTVRTLDIKEGAPAALGGQFGGNYAGVTGFGMADGSAKFFTNTLDPGILRSMFTIAGKGFDPIVGE